MMNTEELSIGNYIEILTTVDGVKVPLGYIKQVSGIKRFDLDLIFLNEPEVTQIPQQTKIDDLCFSHFNESRLLKLGFRNESFSHSDGSVSNNIFVKGKLWLQRPLGFQEKNDSCFILAIKSIGVKEYSYVRNIKYLHELQNFYKLVHKERLVFDN